MATRRSDLARRVADLERAKAEAAAAARTPGVFRGEVVPGMAIWPPWNVVLTDAEWAFVCRLAERQPRPDLPDWRDGWRALCLDGDERAMLEGVLAKEDRRHATGRGTGLEQVLTDLAVVSRRDEDEERVEGAG